MTRILVINPNTTMAVTERMADFGRSIAPAGIELIGQTGRFGARYISDRPSFAIAGHAALDAFAPHAGAVDAVLLACFGDPGLLALKELAAVPVRGLAEAAFTEAAADGRRFGIVTGGMRWRPMLAELAGQLGFSRHLAGIETLTLTGGQIAEAPDAAVEALAHACRTCRDEHGAEIVILGGAGLVGLAARVQPLAGVPVICSVTSGFRAIFAALQDEALQHPSASRDPPPTTASTGLSPELTALLGGDVLRR